jgi:ribosomal protein L11 methyltransferase
VIANILAGTIIELASKLNRHLKTGGQLILSGILASQAERVQNVFPQYNLALDQQEEWVVLHGSRN